MRPNDKTVQRSLLLIALALLTLVVAPVAISAAGPAGKIHAEPAFQYQHETSGSPVAASDEPIPPTVNWFIANCGWGSGGPAAQIGVSLGSAATSSYGASGPHTTDDVHTIDLSAYSAGTVVALENIFFYDAQSSQIGDGHPTGTVTVRDCLEAEFSYSISGTLYDNGNCSSVRIDPAVTTDDVDSILYTRILLPGDDTVFLHWKELFYNADGVAHFWLHLYKLTGTEQDPTADPIVAFGETNVLTLPESCIEEPSPDWTVSIYKSVLGGDPIGQEYCFTVTVTAPASYTEYQGVCLTYPGSVTIPVVKGSGVQVTEVVPDGNNFVSVVSTLPGQPGSSPASWWVGSQAISENNGFVDFNFANELVGKKETPTPPTPKPSNPSQPAGGPGSPQQPGAVSTLPKTGTGRSAVLAEAIMVTAMLLALCALGTALRLRPVDSTEKLRR